MTERAASIDLGVAACWLAAIDRSQFVLELEPDGTIVRANARLCSALGYDEAELVGRRHRELIAPGPHANASAGNRTVRLPIARVMVGGFSCARARPPSWGMTTVRRAFS